MSDETTQAVESSIPDYPLQIGENDNPFAVGETTEDSGYDILMDDEGDMQIVSPPSSEEEEKTTTEEQVELNLFEGIEENRQARILLQLQQQNQALMEKLNAIEKKERSTEENSSKQEALNKVRENLLNAGFMEEQIDALVEMGAFKESLEKSGQNQETQEIDPEELKRFEETKQLIATRYHGQNGAPSIPDMEQYVRYLGQRFNEAELTNVSLPQLFRVAENVPFILWADQAYPEQMKKMNFLDAVAVSEKARENWYVRNGINDKETYFHLTKEAAELLQTSSDNVTNDENEESNKMHNEVLQSMAAQSKEQNLGLPGGNYKDKEIGPRQTKTATEVAKSTIEAFMK